MASVKIENFGGIMPRSHPSLLPDGMAITAHNVKLKNGKIVPLRQPSIVSEIGLMMESGYIDGQMSTLDDIADAHTMHVWKRQDGSVDLLLFKGQTWMAPGNIADDDKTRVIVSGDTQGTFTHSWTENDETKSNTWNGSPLIYMRDGASIVRHPLCKEPLAKPQVSRNDGVLDKFDTITLKGYLSCAGLDALADASTKPNKGDVYYSTDAGTISNGGISTTENSQVVWLGNDRKWGFYDSAAFANIRYTYFFVTWVDAYGYESPVSEPSDEIVYNDGDTMTFQSIDVPNDAKLVRVYKVITGTESGRIQFIAEFPAAQVSASQFPVMVKDEDAGEVLTEITSPPGDLRCILDVPGAFYTGFSPSSPKTVMFSEVDLIYSWPDAYRYDIKDNIVALAVTSNTVFALTDGWPYVLSGTAPEAMTVTKLAGPASCVSARSVCVFKNAVYFASNIGMMVIYNDANAGTVCTNLTDKIFTKDQWLAKNPSSCICGQHDGALHLFFTHGDGSHEGLMIDLNENAAAVTTHDEVAKCLCIDNKTDKMYFVREGV